MANWDFGGAFANTTGELQRQDIAAATAPAVIRQQLALADLREAQAGAARAETRQNEEAARQIAGMDFEGSPSAVATSLATIYARTGNPDAATTALHRAAQIQQAESATLENKAQADKAAAEQQRALAKQYASLLRGVQDQAGLDRANMVFQSLSGEAVPPEFQRYDPRVVEALIRSTTTLAEESLIADRVVDNARQAEESRARIALLGAQRTAALALAGQRDDKAKRDKKAGGKDVAAPKRDQRLAAATILEREGVLAGMEDVVGRSATYDLASYAQAIQRQTPGIDYATALERAFAREVARGAYPELGAQTTLGIPNPLKGQRRGFMPRTSEVPVAVKSAEEAKKLPKGKFFLHGGKVYEALGGGQARLAGSPPEDEDEE